VAPPLQKGRRLAYQRLNGLVFLVVLSSLIGGSIALYAKAFTPFVAVTLQADRIGNQLTKGADVKARGVLVGEVRSVRSTRSGTELELRVREEMARRLPSDTRARLLPKTLFGEKFVALQFDDASTAPPLRDGDVIPQDRSETARETSEALDSLLPLLQTLDPESVSTTLNALSTTLRGRGEKVGSNLSLAREYLASFNPELATLAEDFRGTADLADTFTAATPDLVGVLDDLSVVNRSLVEEQDALEVFLRANAGAADTVRDFVRDNDDRFVALSRESVPNLRVYERYAPGLPCLFRGIAGINAEGERVFGGNQPGLHITAEFTQDQAGYRTGDEPLYGEDAGPTCFGLDGDPIRPFPITVEVTDGYCDDQEAAEGLQTECQREQSSPVRPAASSGLAALMLTLPGG
jgi:phospholipid/cholesterol/gamma-HCH transport system substrate-binding protein